ncbi:type II toxin-antitoxin system HicB family antitoxin [Enterobacter sp. Bisph1]|uniref:type II toxin-antitoxin system HicB family antitoxin n=1 Tax=Enterobacter sp. Bisph1 TaxID=1274399 RepID=UPI00057BF22C|nr:type II toxin-antitoxin system HicB family antitoxin [Enterobacter sp. Bisph1]
MFNYPVRVERDETTGAFVVSCRDLPLMNSVGDSLDDALLQSVDAIVVAIAIEVDERRPIPLASAPQEGEHVISLPVLVAMKAALHNAMIETGTRKADLARKLGQKGPQIDRLLDVEHSSKVETVELALHQLNRQIDLSISQQSRV